MRGEPTLEDSKTYAFSELYRHVPQPDSSIISDGLLKKGSMMVIGGPPKSYKSFLLQHLAICLATGRNLFGATRTAHGRLSKAFLVDRPRRVLFCEQELGEDDLRDRLLPVYESLTPPERALMNANLFTRSMDLELRFDKGAGSTRLEQVITQCGPEIAIFDPLIEFHDQEENSSTAMSGMLKNLKRICARTDVTPILSHHEGKIPDESTKTGGDRLRGASALFGKGDTFLNTTVRNRNAMRIIVDFTLRRGRPLNSIMVQVDRNNLDIRLIAWKGTKEWKTYWSKKDDDIDIDAESVTDSLQ